MTTEKQVIILAPIYLMVGAFLFIWFIETIKPGAGLFFGGIFFCLLALVSSNEGA